MVIPNTYALLQSRKVTGTECGPAFARIRIEPADYGANDPDELYDLDYSGACLTYEGKRYTLKTSIFAVLNRSMATW